MLRFLLCAVPALLAAPPARAQLELEPLIEEALANNPSLSVLEARWRADEARIRPAGALRDPMLKVELSNVPLSDFDFDSTPMSGKQLMLSQHFPYPGKRGARERAATHAAAASRYTHRDREGIIVSGVKKAYYALAFLDRAIAITHKNEELLRDFVRIAQSKYSVGKGLQQDVLKAQVALSGIWDRQIELELARRQAEARLNTLLNRPPQAPLEQVESLQQTPFPYEVESLQQTALEQRPQLKAIEEQMQRWQVREELARLGYKPDFAVNLGYRQRDFAKDPVEGSDFLTLGLTFNLPIYKDRKQAQQVLEARARGRMARAQYETARQQIFFQIQDLYLAQAAHQEQVSLFETTIIPQAEQALNSALAAYEVDEVDFLTLLDNQMTLFNFEIQYYRHLAEREKSLAELEAVVGTRLF